MQRLNKERENNEAEQPLALLDTYILVILLQYLHVLEAHAIEVHLQHLEQAEDHDLRDADNDSEAKKDDFAEVFELLCLDEEGQEEEEDHEDVEGEEQDEYL